jgi:hypothetical protein
VIRSGMPLQGFVAAAFRHSLAQIASRGEAWISNDLYRIEAKPPADAGITNLNHTLFAST